MRIKLLDLGLKETGAEFFNIFVLTALICQICQIITLIIFDWNMQNMKLFIM